MPLSLAERMRAFGFFVTAMMLALGVWILADHAARGLASSDGYELTRAAIMVFLLVIVFSGMGALAQRQSAPVRAMGLWLRPGWLGEIALGIAVGWGGLVASVLPIALFGGLVMQIDLAPHQWLTWTLDLGVLALGALSEELVFRGYPFQRLIEAMGPGLATICMSLFFAFAHLRNPSATAASLSTTLLAGLLFAMTYLRTRALWVGWGFHFGWNASMGLLFGLPISGLTTFSPVVSSYTRGPVWITGGGYGPEGSAIAIIVLFALLFVLTAATRDLRHRYAGPVLIPGGMPVEIDALARLEHERSMGPAAGPATGAAGAQLVQILVPGAPPPGSSDSRNDQP